MRKLHHVPLVASLVIAICSLGAGPPASAVEILVQTEANQGNAGVGESGISIATSAALSFVVTDAGVLVDTLGATVGNGTTAISLPAGWTVLVLSAPPGACSFTFTQFGNPVGSTGSYSLLVVPSTITPSCAWKAGDYNYVASIDTAGYKGSGVGKLTIK